MKHLSLSVALPLAYLLALTTFVEARGQDDDNGRDCSPCVAPNPPSDDTGTLEDTDMWDGREVQPPDPEPPIDDDGR